jgi:hypothetical protein
MHRTHLFFNSRKLMAGLGYGRYVKLVFKISGWHTKFPGYLYHCISFFEVSGKWLFADNSLQFGSAFDRFGYVTHNIEAGKIGSENADHINGFAEGLDILEYPAFAQTIIAGAFGE